MFTVELMIFLFFYRYVCGGWILVLIKVQCGTVLLIMVLHFEYVGGLAVSANITLRY